MVPGKLYSGEVLLNCSGHGNTVSMCFSKIIPIARKKYILSKTSVIPTIYALENWNFGALAWLNQETATIPNAFVQCCGSGSGMRKPDHIFWVKILKFFDVVSDPESFWPWIRDWKKFGSGINIPDPQHWYWQIKKINKSTLEKFWSRIGGTPAESVQLVAGHKLVGETKVRNLDVHLAIQQKVLGLQVPASQKNIFTHLPMLSFCHDLLWSAFSSYPPPPPPHTSVFRVNIHTGSIWKVLVEVFLRLLQREQSERLACR